MRVDRTEGQPHDRLTELAAVMTAALESDPESEGVKAVVMLQDATKGGICIHGYDDEAEAVADLFIHLTAIFESMGKRLMVIPVGQG